MRERDDSPWYPQTLRLFRQAADDSWPAAIERVRFACIAEFSSWDSARGSETVL
jgi:hypothetical protein